MNKEIKTNKTDIMSEDTLFSQDYQVVRGEFFSHVYEPSFTFNNYRVSVNTACIKQLPEYEYIQILVNPNEKKLAVRPCKEEEKDSFRWCSATEKRSPKQITCHMFFAKIMSLMNWNPNYRYKLLGKLVKSDKELLFVFDLTTPEIYKRSKKEHTNTKVTASHKPIFPEEWKNQFGIPFEEHQATLQVNVFNSCTVFEIQDPM